MYIICHIHHVKQRDIATHKLRLYNKITIVKIKIVIHLLLFNHVYVYVINTFYDNTIQFVLVNNIILFFTDQ
jgi:hypothetical protein